MDKMQAYHDFWSSFGWKAYDETSVPDTAVLPYITYESATDSFGTELALNASLWSRSTSWVDITAKEKEIAQYITRGGKVKMYDDGAIWIRKGTPWAQRMSEAGDENIRRILLNLTVEFID